MSFLAYLYYYPALLFALVNSVVAMSSLRHRALTKVVATALIGYFLVNIYMINYPDGYDFSIFRDAGLAVLQGRSPYTDSRFVSPPTALPLFMLFSTFDFHVGLFLWTSLNVLMALAMPALARYYFAPSWSRAELLDCLPITALFVLALPTLWGLHLGQVSLLVAFVLVVALLLKDRRPMVAGLALAISTIKPQSALPLLVLFARSRYFRIAIATFITMLILIAVARPTSFLADVQSNWSNIIELSRPLGVNDFTFDSEFHHTMIGVNYLLYAIGLRERDTLQIISIIVDAVIILGLLYVIVKDIVEPRSIVGLTVCLTLLFVYHRTSDAVILILPATYAYVEARSARSWSKWWFNISFFCILSVWVIHPNAVQMVVDRLLKVLPLLRYPAEALVLPYASWATAIAAASLFAAVQLRDRATTTPTPLIIDAADG